MEKTYTLIPDEKFEQILVDQGLDSDQMVNGQMLYTDAQKISDLIVIFGINKELDLEGIQDFVNLKTLYIYGGAISILDLDDNINLIDVKLEQTIIENHLILPLESDLKNLTLELARLKLLNLRENVKLDSLTVRSNSLEQLNISNSVNLSSLHLTSTTSDFVALDLSSNVNLKTAKLSVAGITSLDISNLTKLKNLNTINCPKLICAKIFENQDISDFKYGYHTTFTTNCNNLPEREYTTITNEEFERTLIINDIDTEDQLDGKVLTKSLENAKGLYIGGRFTTLDSLDGLETLKNIEWIYFYDLFLGNNLRLENYDFSQNTKLKHFTIRGLDQPHGATGIDFVADLSQLKKLETLELTYASFSNLDFRECPDLKVVKVVNDLSLDYDFTGNPELEQIIIERANSVDISQNLKLKELELKSSLIPSLDLSNNSNIESISLDGLTITSLEINNKPQLNELVLKNLNNLATPDIKNNTSLKTYHVEDCNLIGEVDVSSNSGLERLVVKNNQNINSLNIEQNTNLRDLLVWNTRVSRLDLMNNSLLEYLSIRHNPMSEIDISNNLSLSVLSVQHSDISNLDISDHDNLRGLYVRHTNINSLDLRDKTRMELMLLNHNKLTSVDLTNMRILRELYINNNELSQLDLSNNLSLIAANVYDNPDLDCIKIAEIQKISLVSRVNRSEYRTLSTNCL